MTENGPATIYDITPALNFGSLISLFGNAPVMLSTNVVVEQLQLKLATFNDDDYILCIGDPALIAVTAMVASSINDGRVRMLRWDRHQRQYLALKYDLKGE